MRPVKVFLTDDSLVIRRVVGKVLEEKYGFIIAGTAANGQEALEQIPRVRPDVVILDVEMPILDGLAALRQLMRVHPVPVVMLSAHTRAGSAATVEALALGAVDFVPKGMPGGLEPMVADLAAKIKVAVGARLVHAGRGTTARAASLRQGARVPPAWVGTPKPAAERGPAERPEIVVIGCSTGGPAALRVLVPALPGDLPAAVVIVQHMPRGFTASLAENLDQRSALEVKHAAEGDAVLPGRALVAPAGFEFSFRRKGAGVVAGVQPDDRPLPPGGFRPSVDRVMAAAAETYGPRTLGVLLTGMGRDGADGMGRIKAAQGQTIAEDESTCVVYGMPRAAAEAGAADLVLPLPQIAPEIMRVLS
ncbi:MAG: chemotaxis-specific protein-glutamate methyltransferase CheB [Bacillota bacterium]|nr:chemotaxis-specific protein-glutamate methyltransferase CheB [Bacillota bacterium]